MEELIELARKKGTDKEFLLWLRKRPSALSGKMDYDPDTGESFCVAAHFRTAKNSGTGCKPEYSAIPLTDAEHKEQHRIGQFNFKKRDWWERMTKYYLTIWINS
jgi:hypothetical protein